MFFLPKVYGQLKKENYVAFVKKNAHACLKFVKLNHIPVFLLHGLYTLQIKYQEKSCATRQIKPF